jgi:hypothetical protein
MQALIDFVTARARSKGAAAFHAGEDRQAPPEFGTYSGAWVEGWDNAAFDELSSAVPVAA